MEPVELVYTIGEGAAKPVRELIITPAGRSRRIGRRGSLIEVRHLSASFVRRKFLVDRPLASDDGLLPGVIGDLVADLWI
jgi:hypothetical protein